MTASLQYIFISSSLSIEKFLQIVKENILSNVETFEAILCCYIAYNIWLEMNACIFHDIRLSDILILRV